MSRRYSKGDLHIGFCIPQKNLKELIEVLKILEKMGAKQDGGGTNELNQCFLFYVKDTKNNMDKIKKLKDKYKKIIIVSVDKAEI